MNSKPLTGKKMGYIGQLQYLGFTTGHETEDYVHYTSPAGDDLYVGLVREVGYYMMRLNNVDVYHCPVEINEKSVLECLVTQFNFAPAVAHRRQQKIDRLLGG